MSFSSYGQPQQRCYCPTDSLMNEFTGCEHWTLSDKTELYYQFNCDSIWLTLKRDDFRKIIFSTSPELYAYHFRLDPQLIKEFPSFILFRWGCPANGPCNYFLTKKSDGVKTKEFDELVYLGTKDQTNVLIYISEDQENMLELYNVELQKSFDIPFEFSGFRALIPEYQFIETKLNGEMLELSYEFFPNRENDKFEIRRLSLDLSKYSQ